MGARGVPAPTLPRMQRAPPPGRPEALGLQNHKRSRGVALGKTVKVPAGSKRRVAEMSKKTLGLSRFVRIDFDGMPEGRKISWSPVALPDRSMDRTYLAQRL